MTFDAPFRPFSLRRFPTLAVLAFWLAALALSAPARAQQPPAASTPTSSASAQTADLPAATSGDLEALARTLEDPAARERLSQQLRALIDARRADGQATPAATPAPTAAEEELPPDAEANAGARLIYSVSSGVRRLSEQVMAGVGVLKDLPRINAWLKSQADNSAARNFWLSLIGKLALVLICGYVAEWLVGRLLSSPYRRIETAAAEGVFTRLLLGAARCCLDLLAIVAFAAVAYGVLALAEPGARARLVILALVHAHIALRVVLAVVRVLLAPTASRLRPLRVGDETAHYLYIWGRRVASVVIYGYFASEALLLLRFGRDGHDLALKLVGLVTVTMLVIFVMQNRAAVAEWLRARTAGGPVGNVFGRLADLWHLLAATYLIAIYVVWLLEVPNGFAYLVRATLLTLVIAVVARMLLAGSDHAIARMFRVGPELKLRYPGLEARANRYLPVLTKVLHAAVYAIAFILLLQAWGVQSLAWLTSPSGTQLVGTILAVLLVLLLALAAWLAITLSLERYAARLDAADPTSARARTLLPLIRTAIGIVMAVLVGLIVLSQIGIDITPLLAGAGVIGIAIGFGSQKLVQDVINGMFILAEDTISVGDVVSLDSYGGLVEAMTIRHIRLRDFDGSLWTVPFSEVKAVLNRTKDYSRYVFDIEVAYKEDVDHVIEVVKQLGEEMRADPEFGPLMLEPLEIIGLDKFASSGMVIKARIMTPPIKQWTVGREFNRRMKRRFDELGIEIPFPTRTLYHVQRNDAPVYRRGEAGKPVVGPPPEPPSDAPDADTGR